MKEKETIWVFFFIWLQQCSEINKTLSVCQGCGISEPLPTNHRTKHDALAHLRLRNGILNTKPEALGGQLLQAQAWAPGAVSHLSLHKKK